MAFGKKPSWFSVPAIACAVLLAVVLFGPSASAQLPDITVEVGDTTTQPGAMNTAISIFLSNPNDEVGGFNLWIQLDRPDIMQFQIDSVETLITVYWKCTAGWPPPCTDSIESDSSDYDYTTQYLDTLVLGSWDTTGCLTSGWEAIDARSLSQIGQDLNIVGLADYYTGGVTPGISPQSGGVLIRVLADVFQIPDTMVNRTVNILVQHDITDHFSFSRPDGSAIGIKDTLVLDTNYWICTAYAGDVCINWQRVSQPPADSQEIYYRNATVIDYENVFINDGSVTVLNGICGDANGDGRTTANVADLVYLVNFLFKGGPAPSPLWVGDVNCSGGNPNVADLTYLVNFLFKGGLAPCQAPACL